ncbi:MAG: S41 family peptidase [Proteobacteria bacterium]|nr:S41 family peptidase [Pseudomonadota bacterium]
MKREAARAWARAAAAAATLLALALVFGARAEGPAEAPASALRASAGEPLFVKAYQALAAYYLEPVEMGALALAGLQAIRGLDADLRAERVENRLRLWRGAAMLAEEEAPAEGDARAWGALSARLAARAQAASARLGEADAERLFEAVMGGVLARLDPYSRYAAPAVAGELRARRSGFGGIGIRLALIDGRARISEVMPGTPAEAAGLAAGDEIVSVDGAAVAGLGVEAIIALVRGRVDSRVELGVARPGGAPRAVALTRARIVPTTVHVEPADGIVELRVSAFNSETAASLARAVEGAAGGATRPRGLILDFRGNRGGLLHEAVAVADIFLARGLVIATRGRHAKSTRDFEADGRELARGLPLVVLIDGKSASASEIVAASLQAHGRAVVVGSNSYGKGVVQTVVRMPNGGEMTVTWSRLYTPAGNTFNGIGVMPSFCALGTPDEAERRMAEDGGPGSATLAALSLWRAASAGEAMERERARAACRGIEADGAAALRIARRLIDDAGLYARAREATTAALWNREPPSPVAALPDEPGAAAPLAAQRPAP